LFVAQRNDEVVGFIVATPIPARGGWLIEQIVRGRAAPNGTAELMLCAAAASFVADNVALITLGLAPLAARGVPHTDQAPRYLRVLLRALRTYARSFYNFAGLEAFKAKFGGADWSAVYASLSPGTSVPRALRAVAGAFSGEPLRKFIPHAVGHVIRHVGENRKAVAEVTSARGPAFPNSGHSGPPRNL
jgi:phosphatidylglycerol lysyltransferase